MDVAKGEQQVVGLPLWMASDRDFAVYMMDPDGRVVGWTAEAERLKGYRAEEIIGRSFAVFYPPEEVERGEPARHLAEAASAGNVAYQGWRVSKDGSHIWADIVLTAVFDDQGHLHGYGKVICDATERHNAENELRDKKQNLELLVASLDRYAILMLDPEGRVASWSTGAEHITGYRSEEIVGRSFEVFYPPEEVAEGEPSRHLAAAASTGSVEVEGWRVRQDGSRFWADVVLTGVFDDRGQLQGYGTITYDHGASQQGAGPHPGDSEQHPGARRASARDYATLMLDPAGRVTALSTGAERINGYRAREIVGRSFDVFYPPNQVAGGAPARNLAEAAARGHLEYEGWRVRQDGSWFWADVVITAVFDDQGHLQGYGKVTRDATERHDAEQEMRDSEEHLSRLVVSVRDYAILMLDPAGRVVGWNASVERIKGYHAEEVIGRSLAVFYPPEEEGRGDPARHLAEAAAAGHVAYQGWRVRRDGSRFWADVVLTAVFDDRGHLCGFGNVSCDATERRDAEQSLRDNETHLGLLVASVRNYAILMLDPTGRVLSWNMGAQRIKGYRAEEIIGRSFAVFYPPEEVERGDPARHLAEAAATGHVSYQGWRVRRDGSRFWADVVLTAVLDDQGHLRGYGKVTRDASEQRRLEAALADQVLHDPLTGLGNRTLLMERIEHARTRLSRRTGLLTLLFLDLDRFKPVNDALGHEVGDELLVQAAALLRGALRPEDTVVRFGGDEFVALCEDLADHSEAESVARRVTNALNVPVSLRGREVFLSASVGVVTDAGARTSQDLLRDADAAMYLAKERGGGRYALVDDASGATRSDRLQLSSELQRSLERDELRAWYQPLSDLHTGEVLGFEALLRWQHPDRGLLPPAVFLNLADDVGSIVELDAWMLHTACMDIAQRGERLGRPTGVWVNVSGRSLADAALPGAVSAALSRSGLDPALLTLEITEGALMSDAAATARTLATLRGLGVRLAIDDFGTGYSSLAYLQRFPVHGLKVDRSFVEGLDAVTDHESTAIVRAIVCLAEALDLRTVAEGIQTPRQLAAVTSLGCDLGQGFLLGRPAPGEEIREGSQAASPHVPAPAAEGVKRTSVA